MEKEVERRIEARRLSDFETLKSGKNFLMVEENEDKKSACAILNILPENYEKFKKQQQIPEQFLKEDYNPCTVKDFLNIPDKKEKPIINPLVLENAITTFFGLPASCKSILAMNLGVCIATGKKFLNKYKCRKKNLLYLSTESSERLDRKRLRANCRGLKIIPTKRKLENFSFFYCPRKKISLLNDTYYFESLKETIRTKDIKVLVIDTLSPMIADSKDFASEIVKIYTKLFSLIDEFNLSIILIMHSQKTGFDVLGSVKHKASADVFYEVRREEKDANNIITLGCHKGREGELNISFKIIFNQDKHFSINFEFVDEWGGRQTPKNKDNNPKKEEQTKAFILELLADNELPYNQIIKECVLKGYAPATSKRAMNSLYESQKIIKKKGKNGGYCINDTNSPL